jgi:hypothetical protein
VYITHDVTFDEQVFPFEKLHENVGAKLRQEILLLPSNLLPRYDGAYRDRVSLPREENNEQNPETVQEEPAEEETDVLIPGVPSASDIDSVPMIGTEIPDDSGIDSCVDSRADQPSVRHGGTGDSPAQSHVPRTTKSGHLSQLDHVGYVEEMNNGDRHVANQGGVKTRSKSGIFKPKIYTDDTVRYSLYTSTWEPQIPSEAFGNENWKKTMDVEYEALKNKNWKKAMNVEYEALKNNKTWHLVAPTQGKNIIDCKWVYMVKRKADGSIDRYKA